MEALNGFFSTVAKIFFLTIFLMVAVVIAKFWLLNKIRKMFSSKRNMENAVEAGNVIYDRFVKKKNGIQAEPVCQKKSQNEDEEENGIDYLTHHPRWPYEKRSVMSPSELIFFEELRKALPHKLLFTQVSMSQILKGPKDMKKWHGKIGQKSLDYVFCNSDGSVLLAVELDDRSHVGRNKEDATKEKALRDAGIPFIRWHVENMPDVALIRETVMKRLTEHRNPS